MTPFGRFAIVITAVMLVAAFLIIPWNTVNLLQEPASEYSTPTIRIVTGPHSVTLETVSVFVSAEAAISAANPLTINVTLWDGGGGVASALNLTRVTFVEGGALGYPAPVSSKYYQPSVVELHREKSGLWSGSSEMVYFISGTFNGTMSLYSGQTLVESLNVPNELQVSAESVTFAFVGELANISLTLVLVAFVIFELRNVGSNGTPKGQKRIDSYVRKRRGKRFGKLRGDKEESGENDVSEGKEE